jgi:UDP-N-acetylmuramate dehydrogenase
MLNIQEQMDLTPLNTLHLKSTASHYMTLDNVEQLEAISMVLSNVPQFFVLGGGSNLIVPKKYQGLVIHNQLLGISITQQGNHKMVRAMAGENWDEFVFYCIEQGAFGLENLSLIPGTVGASPIQNIGAYGVEVKDFIDEVLVYDLKEAKTIILKNQDCKFSYRNSILKNNSRYIVISVCFKLLAQPDLNLHYGEVAQRISSIHTPSPKDLRNVIINIRQSKLPDPKDLGNAGSFFHNPIISEQKAKDLLVLYPNLPQFPTIDSNYIKISAGWLIDNLGLKGIRKGKVGIYSKQALVLINYEDACQSELLGFAEWIQSQVKNHYGISLQIEPIILS